MRPAMFRMSSFRMRLSRWVSTIRGLIPSSAAISLLVSPSENPGKYVTFARRQPFESVLPLLVFEFAAHGRAELVGHRGARIRTSVHPSFSVRYSQSLALPLQGSDVCYRFDFHDTIYDFLF
jgi:hypothetical protein